MSKKQILRAFVNERLSAAAEEICALFERIFAEYEEELCRSKAEKQKKYELLDSALNPRVLLFRVNTVLSPNQKITPRIKEEEPEKRSIKQEEEEHLQVFVQESNGNVKTEESSSPLQQSPPEDREETRGLDIGSHLDTDTEEPTDHSSDYDEDCPGAQVTMSTPRDTRTAPTNSGPVVSKLKLDTEETTALASDTDSDGSYSPGAQMETDEDDNSSSYVQIRKSRSAPPNPSLFLPKYKSGTEEPTDHSSDTDNDEDGPGAQVDAEKYHNHFRIPNRRTATPNSSLLLPNYKCAPETSPTTNNGHVSRSAKGAKEKRHQCSVCTKRFGKKQHLQNHMEVHTRVRPYSCPVCEKAFSHKFGVYRHMTVHTGERPYSCSTCGKTFTRKYGLNVHKRTHTGESPYTCPTCKKGFKKNCTLKKHLENHKKKQ